MSTAAEHDDAAVVIINMQRHIDAANRLLLDRAIEYIDDDNAQGARNLLVSMRDTLKEPQ